MTNLTHCGFFDRQGNKHVLRENNCVSEVKFVKGNIAVICESIDLEKNKSIVEVEKSMIIMLCNRVSGFLVICLSLALNENTTIIQR